MLAESRTVVREVEVADRQAWVGMRGELWPEGEGDHERESAAYFASRERDQQVVFVAEENGALLGFAEVSLRAYADGCESSPVGYLEGWFVRPEARERGVGRLLVSAGEAWARARGCSEFASDADVENAASAAAHSSLGFEEVGIVRLFRKSL